MNVNDDSKEPEEGAEPLFFLHENAQVSFYIGKNAGARLNKSILGAKNSIKIISPFLGEGEIDKLREKCLGGVRDIALVTAASEDELGKPWHIRALKKLYGKHDRETSFCRCLFLKNNPVHAKLYVIDDEIAYTGSLNFTAKGFSKNHESCFTVKDKETVRGLGIYFEKLFNGKFARWTVAEISDKIARFEAGRGPYQAEKPRRPETERKNAEAAPQTEPPPPPKKGLFGGFFKR